MSAIAVGAEDLVFRFSGALALCCLLFIGQDAALAVDKHHSGKPNSGASDDGFKRSAGAIKCWYFNQKNMIFGDCEVYVSPQALKITFANEKWANLAKPPDWDLFVFNPKAKVYCRTPLKEWRGRKLGSAYVKGLKPVEKSEVIAGIRAKAYDAESIEPGLRNISRIYVAEDLGLPPQISTILCGNDAIPVVKGVPLRVQHAASKEAPSRTIDTYIAKQKVMPKDFFEVPAGFRLVTKPEDVITGGISDIIEEMAK